MGRPSNTDERRAQIVAALLAVMAKHGYDGASIADIAARAKLATGLVHYHFGTKLEILIEAVRVMTAEHARLLDAALDGLPTHAARLAMLIEVHVGLGAHADPARLACWIQVAGEALRHPRVRVEQEAAIAGVAARFTSVIASGVAAGELACAHPAAAGAALTAAIQGYFVVAATARDVIPSGSAAICMRQMATGLLQPTKPLTAPRKRGK